MSVIDAERPRQIEAEGSKADAYAIMNLPNDPDGVIRDVCLTLAEAKAALQRWHPYGKIAPLYLNCRSASQATRDEVIEECARIADAVALETRSTGLARLDKDDRSSATIGECYECEAVAAEDVAERIRAIRTKPGTQEGWLPIESAPKGTKVVVRSGPTIDIAYLESHGEPFKDTWRYAGSNGRTALGYWPTHYKLLDAPPGSLSRDGEAA